MKYMNFKRFKFSTIFKKINLKSYNFSKIYRFFNIRRFDYTKITRYFNLRRYNLGSPNIASLKKINFRSNKFLMFHLPSSIIFFTFLYLAIPTFYNYDKSVLENVICKNKNIKCNIIGKVSYQFYPTPRLKVKNIIIKDQADKKIKLITAQDVDVKLSIKNLLAKEKHTYTSILFDKFEINLDIKKIKRYQELLRRKISFYTIDFLRGKILFLNDKEYVASITDANLKFILNQNINNVEIKGKFIGQDISIDFSNKKKNKETPINISVKMPSINLLSKIDFYERKKNEDSISGKILLRKDKNKITGLFDYINDELVINKSNLRNSFIDGKLEGKIKFFPFFGFNLDINLNSINFTKIHNYLSSLNKLEQRNLFKINNKINGNINVSAGKVYSKYNLTNSFETKLKFNNGDVFVERFLLNLGKVGAADILGIIKNDKKFSNFKFESNVFVDNQKKFLSKFGIYNKEKVSSNFFVKGNFDLQNTKISIYEISADEKYSDEDTNFIENEFNDIMLESGYESLFYFPNFKDFIKSVTSEEN